MKQNQSEDHCPHPDSGRDHIAQDGHQFQSQDLYSSLFQQLNFTNNTHFAVALSGGADSVALLIALSCLRDNNRISGQITAFHFNHLIQPEAMLWQEFCENLCQRLEITLCTGSWKRENDDQISENNAREARYRWFAESLKPDQVLLTAHHQGDQAESVLLNLVQGRGHTRMGAIPDRRFLTYTDQRLVARPLLGYTKQQLIDFLKTRKQHWVEDQSNHHSNFDRNFIRHQLLPMMSDRWPQVHNNIQRYAQNAKRYGELFDQLLNRSLDKHLAIEKACIFALATPLDIKELRTLSEFDWCHYILCWLHRFGHPAPTTKQLISLYHQVNIKHAGNDKNPSLIWGERRICHYEGYLHLISGSLKRPETALTINVQAKEVALGNGLYTVIEHGKTHGLRPAALDNGHAKWCWRVGGERLTLPGRQHRTTLKNVFNQLRVPPWERDFVPFLVIDEEIAWVFRVGPSAGFASDSAEDGAISPTLRYQKTVN